jgi:hypothetical protein
MSTSSGHRHVPLVPEAQLCSHLEARRLSSSHGRKHNISHSAQPSTCLACDISFFCRIRPLSNVPSAHTLIAASHFPGAVVNHVCLPAMAGNRDAQSIHQQGCATDAGTSHTLNFCSLHLRANSAKASRVHVVNDYTTQPRR